MYRLEKMAVCEVIENHYITDEPNQSSNIPPDLEMINGCVKVKYINGDEFWVKPYKNMSDYGFFMVPLVGDFVRVYFYSSISKTPEYEPFTKHSKNPAPSKYHDFTKNHGYTTPNGVFVRLSDNDDSVMIETPKGKKLYISDGVDDLSKERIYLEFERGSVEIDGEKLELSFDETKVTLDSSSIDTKTVNDSSISETKYLLSNDIKVEAATVKASVGGVEIGISGSNIKIAGNIHCNGVVYAKDFQQE